MPMIEIWSDIACPWCYLGRHRLARALEESQARVEMRWRAFELQPQLPVEGVDALPFFLAKFGSEATMRSAFGQLRDLGAAEGVRFDFGAMRRAPNTHLAHRLIALTGDALVEPLFRAHCAEGLDIADLDVLLAVAERTGLDSAELLAELAAGGGEASVSTDLTAAAELGISAVPFFLFARRYAVSGAQPPEVLAKLLAPVLT